MSLNDSIHKQFGIDEIYFQEKFSLNLLEKLQIRAFFCFDGEDSFIQNHVSHDLILIFHHRVPSHSVIYKFLKILDQHKDKKNYIELNTLLNEEEFFLAIKSKKYYLITPQILVKESSEAR